MPLPPARRHAPEGAGSEWIFSRAVIVAVAVNEDGKREVLGIATGPSAAETFWTQIAPTKRLERVNRKIKRRAGVVGIFPIDGAIVRLVGALMLETDDEWAVARHSMILETLARVTDNPTVRLPTVAA